MGEGMNKNTYKGMDDARGFTLLEVMISLAILAMGILGVVGMFTSSIGGNAQGKHLTEATNMAQSKLDYLSNVVVFEDLPSVNGSSTSGIYNMTWRSYIPVAGIGKDLQQIEVTVEWDKSLIDVNANGNPHQVKLSTLRSKN